MARTKVLWFSPVPLPAVSEELGLEQSYGGGWVYSLLRELADRKGVELAVAWARQGCAVRRSFLKDGVRYYVTPNPGWLVRGSGFIRKVTNRLEPFLGHVRDRRAVAESAAVVRDFVPDLVHVFGAEHCYGLVVPVIQVPTVVWIQGILDVYGHHYFGSAGCVERLRHPGMLFGHQRMLAEAARERQIYSSCRYFMGRTTWDAAHQARLQPQGHYYSVQECIRPEFHAAVPWRGDAARALTVYTTTSGALLKGTDVLVRAVALLRRQYPRIELRVAGSLERRNPVARRLFRLVKELRLSHHVKFLGQLDAAQIVLELTQARAFVLPSFIENSSNSLAEAQLVGTPVVASFVGGVPDMVKDDETGLLFQAGDSSGLAWQIGRLFADDALAERLSFEERRIARIRHAPGTIVDALLRAYESILATRGDLLRA